MVRHETIALAKERSMLVVASAIELRTGTGAPTSLGGLGIERAQTERRFVQFARNSSMNEFTSGTLITSRLAMRVAHFDPAP